KVAAAVKEARKYIEILRSKNPVDLWVAILEGRMSYVEGKSSAVSMLTEADKKASARMGNQPMRQWLRNFRDAKQHLAEAYAGGLDLQLAVNKYQELLKQLHDDGQPDDSQVRMKMANVYLSMKMYAEANTEYERINKMVGDDPVLLTQWADSALKSGNP